MIHPPHLTLYAIVAATTCGASLVLLVFGSLYSSARVLVMHWARERGEGRRDLRPEKAHRLTTAATSGSISGSSPPQTSRRSGGSAALAGWSAARRPGLNFHVMQLGFVMQADAAPHDDRRFWPDVVDQTFAFRSAVQRGETLEHATEVALVADPAFDLCRALPALFLDGAIIAVRPGVTPCRK
jgi:hypothetical protein